MGTGWAVGSATMLGVTVAAIAIASEASSPNAILLGVGLAIWLGSWAYGIATAAYGSRAALVGLAGNMLVAMGGLGPMLWRLPGLGRGAALLMLVVGALALLGIVSEARRRAGGIQLWTLFTMLAPLALGAGLALTALSLVSAAP